jgi:hypothetical protein
MALTYERISPKQIKVCRDGAFLCWLDRTIRRQTTGFHTQRFTYWEARFCGHEVKALTLADAKGKIEAVVVWLESARGAA